MGTFDYLYCEYELPEYPESVRGFQTEDLECELNTILITSDGRLYKHHVGAYNPAYEVANNFSGTIYFHGSNVIGGAAGFIFTANGEEAEFVEYAADFIQGQLAAICCTKHTFEPAKPAAEMGDYAFKKSTYGKTDAKEDSSSSDRGVSSGRSGNSTG